MSCPNCGYEPPTAAELRPVIVHLTRAVTRDGLRAMARDVGIGPATLTRAISRPASMTAETRAAIDGWNRRYDRMLTGVMEAIAEEGGRPDGRWAPLRPKGDSES